VRKGSRPRARPPSAWPTLVNRRLLRIEERLDMRRVELTHDVLHRVVRASPMRASNAKRATRGGAQARRATRTRTRDAQGAGARAANRRRLRRDLAIAAAGSAVFGYFSMKRAAGGRGEGQQTRLLAEPRAANRKAGCLPARRFLPGIGACGPASTSSARSRSARWTTTTRCHPRLAHDAKTERNRALGAGALWRRPAHAVEARGGQTRPSMRRCRF
jgi:hypothetical protein